MQRTIFCLSLILGLSACGTKLSDSGTIDTGVNQTGGTDGGTTGGTDGGTTGGGTTGGGTTGGGTTGGTTATNCDSTNEDCAPGTCGGEGSTMLPGSDCVACHSPGNMGNEEEANKYYGIAGTIFEDIDGSSGASGVTIRVTDANGDVTELSSNSAGNFYTTATPVYPITAEVERSGVVQQMVTQPTTAACNSCHACTGLSGGKLYAP